MVMLMTFEMYRILSHARGVYTHRVKYVSFYKHASKILEKI